MAVPITSWISLPMIAISAITQRIIERNLGNCCLHNIAKSLPVTIPILALKIWIIRPHNVAKISVHINPYPPLVPASKSASTIKVLNCNL